MPESMMEKYDPAMFTLKPQKAKKQPKPTQEELDKVAELVKQRAAELAQAKKEV